MKRMKELFKNFEGKKFVAETKLLDKKLQKLQNFKKINKR